MQAENQAIGRIQMLGKLISSPISNTTEVSHTFLPSDPGLRVFLVIDTAFLIMACLGLIYIVRSSFFADRSKRRQHNIGFKSCHRLPCNHCRYFSHNPYLKCSLHPTTVSTKQAIDCRDYAPHHAVASVASNSSIVRNN
jgi:hypothetical protein